MRYPQQSSGPVTRVIVRTAGSAMRHPEVTRSAVSPHHHNCPPPAELLRADQHIVRGPPVNVHDEAHAARVPLQRGVVQTWGEIVIRSWVVTAGLWSGNHPGTKYLAEYFVQSCKIIMISCCSDWLKYLAHNYSFLDNFLVLVVSGSASSS